jgi:hypothetical protein
MIHSSFISKTLQKQTYQNLYNKHGARFRNDKYNQELLQTIGDMVRTSFFF